MQGVYLTALVLMLMWPLIVYYYDRNLLDRYNENMQRDMSLGFYSALVGVLGGDNNGREKLLDSGVPQDPNTNSAIVASVEMGQAFEPGILPPYITQVWCM